MSEMFKFEYWFIENNKDKLEKVINTFGGETLPENSYFILGDACSYFNLADVIFTPGNCFGVMTGGFDFALIKNYGWDLQRKLISNIVNYNDNKTKETFLGIGDAYNLEYQTKHIMYAPTMEIPSKIEDEDIIFDAFSACLRETDSLPKESKEKKRGYVKILTPFFGSGTGCVDPVVSFGKMLDAINSFEKLKK